MKELSIEEKAKRYDEALERARKLYEQGTITESLCYVFPELKESEDENIRKELIKFINDKVEQGSVNAEQFVKHKSWTAWLEAPGEHANFRDSIQVGDKVTRNEDGVLVNLSQLKRIAKPTENKGKNNMGISEATKQKLEDNLNKALEKETPESWNEFLDEQDKQDNNEDMNILQRFSFYSYKDEPDVLYLSGLYVNEKFRNKGIGTKILEVTDEVAKSLNCHTIRLKTKKDSNAERLYRTHGYNSLTTEGSDEIWLEKQDEQKSIKEHNVCDFCEDRYGCVNPCPMKLIEAEKPADKVEPKFKVGDWIIKNDDSSINIDYSCCKITKVENGNYTIESIYGYKGYNTFEIFEKDYHLWTIKDAKDGDVLYLQKDGKEHIIIYKGVLKERFMTFVSAYCAYNGIVDAFCFADVSRYVDIAYRGIMPATKEQCDQLEKAMADAGYTFDFDKRELKKIEQKPAETEKGVKGNFREIPFSEQKPAWSEEDENRMKKVMHILSLDGRISNAELQSIYDWLKSLKPQSTWKPSEEQMNTLEQWLKDNQYKGDARYCYPIFESLYQDLQKLKG